MTAKIVDLDKWRADHPPALRLMTITLHCWVTTWRLWAALISSYGPRR